MQIVLNIQSFYFLFFSQFIFAKSWKIPWKCNSVRQAFSKYVTTQRGKNKWLCFVSSLEKNVNGNNISWAHVQCTFQIVFLGSRGKSEMWCSCVRRFLLHYFNPFVSKAKWIGSILIMTKAFTTNIHILQ